MPKFEVFMDCTYMIEIEAEDEDEAIREAMSINLDDWEQISADIKAEEIED